MPLSDFLNPQPAASGLGDLKDKWTNWAKSPEGKANLIQMGVNLLQPIQPGQDFLGHVGTAIGAGQEAADRSKVGQMEQQRLEQTAQDKSLARQLDERRLDLAEQELGMKGPLIEAQTARQRAMAENPGGSSGGTGTLTREMRQVNMIRDGWEAIVEANLGVPESTFEDYLAERGLTPEQFREIEARAFALEQRAASQGGAGAPAASGGPSGAPAQQPAPPPTQQPQAQGEVQPRPTTEIVADPTGQQVLGRIAEALKSDDPSVKAAGRRAFGKLQAKVTDPRALELAIQQLMQGGPGAPTLR